MYFVICIDISNLNIMYIFQYNIQTSYLKCTTLNTIEILPIDFKSEIQNELDEIMQKSWLYYQIHGIASSLLYES